MKLAGKVALVTGGGTGVGLACSKALAAEGAAVAVNYSRSADDAARTVEDIRRAGGRAMSVLADVSEDLLVNRMVDKVVSEFGRLDILINNAATTKFIDHADLDAMTDEIWDRLFDVNVKGVWYCCRAAAKPMKPQGSGCIINIASTAGINGVGSSVAYCASKAAVLNMTKSLARALAPQVRVNAIAPGFIDTRWTADQQAARERHRAATPLGRVGVPDDIAGAVMYLAGADWVTGQTFVLDGGRTL